MIFNEKFAISRFAIEKDLNDLRKVQNELSGAFLINLYFVHLSQV